MSAPTITPSASAFDWQVSPEGSGKPASLTVQLRRKIHVLPWFRFVSAEGDDGHATVSFASHTISIEGHGLAALLEAVSSQRLVRIVQPTENEAKFRVRGEGANPYAGPGISGIKIEAAGQ